MPQTSEQWLEEKLNNYYGDPKTTLLDMLENTNNVMEQYLKSPNIATKGVLEACQIHNEMFLKELNNFLDILE